MDEDVDLQDVEEPILDDAPDITDEDDLDDLIEDLEADDKHTKYAEFFENIADDVPEDVETELVTMLLDRIDEDDEAQTEANKLYEEGLRRTGMSKDAPGGAGFEGASRAVHPILAELAIDCSSRLLRELLSQQDIVKIDVDGKMTPERWKQASRKQKLLNEQLRDPEYAFEASFEAMTTQAPINGDQYIKIYYDENLGHPRFEFVPSDQIIVAATASSFESAQRKTHSLKVNLADFEERVASGTYRDLGVPITGDVEDKTGPEQQTEKISGVDPDDSAEDGVKLVYECHCRIDWSKYDNAKDADAAQASGRAAPYIATIDVASRRLLALQRNWRYGDNKYRERRHFVQAKFLPWRGPKGIGLVHLIGSLSGALTGTVRALLDAAHIQNSPTALKLRFGQVASQNQSIDIGQVNEFTADGNVTDIRQMFMPLPFNGPSTVLVSLLGDLDKLARGVVRTMMDDMGQNQAANAPVGTTLSRVEQGLMVFSSIFLRFHRVVKQCAEILAELNYLHLEDIELTPEQVGDEVATRDDFDITDDVFPVADSNTFSTAQRLSQLQGVLQLAQQQPDLYDMQAIHKRLLHLMKVENIKELVPPRQDQKDENPVTENVKLSMGQPAFALPDQDHEAHLKVHLDFTMSPIFGMNPMFQAQLLPMMLDHLKNHLTLGYAQAMLEQVNNYLPVPLEDLMEEDADLMEKVSQLLAATSDKALKEVQETLTPYTEAIQKLTALYQQMQAQMPQPIDPVQAQLQLGQQQAQVMIESKKIDSQVQLSEQNRKTQQDVVKAQEADKKLQLDEKRLRLEAEQATQELAIKQAALAQDGDQAELNAETEILKNVQDNQTAIQITEGKIAAGMAAGNLTTGDGINPGG